MAAQVKVSPRFKRLCTQFGNILGGESEVDEGPVCFVTRKTNAFSSCSNTNVLI